MKLYKIGSTWKDAKYCTEQELIDAVIFYYGFTKAKAKAYIRTIDEETKIEILTGYNNQATLAAYYD